MFAEYFLLSVTLGKKRDSGSAYTMRTIVSTIFDVWNKSFTS
jgi:hypothetical protein